MYNLINLTTQDLDLIGAGLAKLPHEQMIGLYTKIQEQFRMQYAAEQLAKEIAAAPDAPTMQAEIKKPGRPKKVA